jgi:hypothetical protein
VSDEGSTGTDVPVEVPPRVRRAVHWFLLVFAITGVAHLELWPFTGFRLFSELRTAEREGWALVAVDPHGEEHPIDLADLPVAYRNTARLVDGFEDRSRAERDEVCDAWAEAVRDAGGAVDHVRIYAVVASVRPDGPPPRRALAYECGTGR